MKKLVKKYRAVRKRFKANVAGFFGALIIAIIYLQEDY